MSEIKSFKEFITEASVSQSKSANKLLKMLEQYPEGHEVTQVFMKKDMKIDISEAIKLVKEESNVSFTFYQGTKEVKEIRLGASMYLYP